MALQKVECLSCEGRFFVDSDIVPDNAEPGEAFPVLCTYCTDGQYAMVVVNEEKVKSR